MNRWSKKSSEGVGGGRKTKKDRLEKGKPIGFGTEEHT